MLAFIFLKSVVLLVCHFPLFGSYGYTSTSLFFFIIIKEKHSFKIQMIRPALFSPDGWARCGEMSERPGCPSAPASVHTGMWGLALTCQVPQFFPE